MSAITDAFTAVFLGPLGSGLNADGTNYAPSIAAAAGLGPVINNAIPQAQDLGALQSQVNTISGRVNANANALSAHDRRLNDHDVTLADIASWRASETQTVGSYGSRLDTLDSARTSNTAAISFLSQRTNALEGVTGAAGSGNAALSTRIGQEVSDRQNGDGNLSTRIAQEVADRGAAASALQGQVVGVKSAADASTAAIAFLSPRTTVLERIANDPGTGNLVLAARLGQEATTRQSGDDALQAQVSGVGSSANASTAAIALLSPRTTALEGVSGDPGTGNAALGQRLMAEIVARQGGDGALSTRIGQEVADRGAAISTEATVRAAAVADLIQRLGAVNTGLYPWTRPGDGPLGFTTSNGGGPPDALPPVALPSPGYALATVADGRGVALSASRELWGRRYAACESGRLSTARWRYTRAVAPADPNGDAIQSLVTWLRPDYSVIASQVVDTTALLPAGTSAEVTLGIGDPGAPGVTVPRPAGAAYYQLGLRSYGAEGTTVVTDMHHDDVSDVVALLKAGLLTLKASSTNPVIWADGSNAWSADQSLGGHRLTALGDGAAASDAVNRGQLTAVQSAMAGLVAALQAQVAALPTVTDQVTLYPGIEEAWTDALGNVMMARRSDGRIHIGETYRPVTAYEVPAPGGGRDIYLCADGASEFNLTGGEFADHALVAVDTDSVAWVGRRGGTATPVRTPLRVVSSAAPGIVTVYGMPLIGQSNGTGANNYQVLTKTALDPGRGLMFNIGTKTLGTDQNYTDLATLLPDANIQSLVDAFEAAVAPAYAYGETPCCYAAHLYLATAPANVAVIVGTHAIGSQPIAALGPGSAPWLNLLKAVRRGQLLARLKGARYRVLHVPMVQGEADCGRTQAAYYADLLTFQSALQVAVQRITGQVEPVKMVLSGMSISPGSGVPLAQLQAAIEHPDAFLLASPRYQMGYVDNLHHDALGAAWVGAYLGRAAALDQFSGTPWLPLHARSAIRSGTGVALKFNLPPGGGGLVFDTTSVTDPTGGDYGLRFYDNAPGTPKSASVTLVDPGIARPQITAPDTISCQLTGVPTGPSPRIEIAQSTDLPGIADGQFIGPGPGGPRASPRACIRNNRATPFAILDQAGPTTAAKPDPTPGQMFQVGSHDWACHQAIALTGS